MGTSCIMCGNHQTKHFIRAKIGLYTLLAISAVIGTLEASHHISNKINHSNALAILFALIFGVLSIHIFYVIYKFIGWLVRQNTACTKCNHRSCATH